MVKGFPGIVDDKARTISLWMKSNDLSGTITSWGQNGNGQLWEVEIINGKLGLNVGGGRTETISTLNDAWHHVAVVFPSSADSLSDVVIYIDGIVQAVTSTNDREIATAEANDLLIVQILAVIICLGLLMSFDFMKWDLVPTI